jgi:hypothetical protein
MLYTQDEEAEESAAVSDICYVLYGESAKCNKYMGSDGGYNVRIQSSFFLVGFTRQLVSP